MSEETREEHVPVVEERVRVDKRNVETGSVRVTTTVDEHTEHVHEDLVREEVEIERVPMEREVNSPLDSRWEGDVLVIPVMEERLVVERRWVLKEEIRVRKRRSVEGIDVPVPLKRTTVDIERNPAGESD